MGAVAAPRRRPASAHRPRARRPRPPPRPRAGGLPAHGDPVAPPPRTRPALHAVAAARTLRRGVGAHAALLAGSCHAPARGGGPGGERRPSPSFWRKRRGDPLGRPALSGRHRRFPRGTDQAPLPGSGRDPAVAAASPRRSRQLGDPRSRRLGRGRARLDFLSGRLRVRPPRPGHRPADRPAAGGSGRGAHPGLRRGHRTRRGGGPGAGRRRCCSNRTQSRWRRRLATSPAAPWSRGTPFPRRPARSTSSSPTRPSTRAGDRA